MKLTKCKEMKIIGISPLRGGNITRNARKGQLAVLNEADLSNLHPCSLPAPKTSHFQALHLPLSLYPAAHHGIHIRGPGRRKRPSPRRCTFASHRHHVDLWRQPLQALRIGQVALPTLRQQQGGNKVWVSRLSTRIGRREL